MEKQAMENRGGQKNKENYTNGKGVVGGDVLDLFIIDWTMMIMDDRYMKTCLYAFL